MLRDEERLLIAAAVDGPLTAGDDLTFRQLLADSNEAGILFRKLTADRGRIAAIPRRSAPIQIAQQIRSRIASKSFIRERSTHKGIRSHSWLPYAFAASVLIAVTCGSFAIFNRNVNREFAQHFVIPEKTFAQIDDSGVAIIVPKNTREELPFPEVNSGVALLQPQTQVEIPATSSTTNTKSESKDWYGYSTLSNVPPLQSISARIPYLFQLSEIEQDDVKKRVIEEIKTSPAVRIDLFSKDIQKTLDEMTVAGKSIGMTIAISPLIHEQLKRKALPSFVIYTESLSAKDGSQLLSQLAANDRAVKVLGNAHIIASSPTDSRDLKAALGIDPGLMKRPKNEINQAISSSTLDQVTNNLNQTASKQAIALTFGQANARSSTQKSPEIKAFLDRRMERNQNIVPMIINIRSATN